MLTIQVKLRNKGFCGGLPSEKDVEEVSENATGVFKRKKRKRMYAEDAD